MSPGATLSHYRIESRLGAGGMGEVYRALDTKLDRTVAIKILKPEFARDPQQMQRFRQEAKAVAAMNHPNVAQIHEIDEDQGLRFIAMEFVEGVTLAARIKQGPLESDAVIRIASQLCGALSEAQAKGITHRDIKPGNIMITPRGQIKILDFGLAKFDPIGDQPTKANTAPGVVLGTFEYMSPEQATGQDVDHRSDIFSLGSVMYEMATGVSPFRAGNTMAIYHAVLNKNPPPPREVNPAVPPGLNTAIGKAIEKDRERRYQSAGDLDADLQLLARGIVPGGSTSRSRLLVALAAVAILATASALLLWQRGSRVSTSVNWKSTPLTSDPGMESQASFSPDGTTIAYAANGEREENWDIYVKQVDSAGTPLRLTNDPASDLSPAWSPDGRSIAFLRQADTTASFILIPALGGGLERKLADAHPSRIGVESPFIAWSPDSKVLALVDRSEPDPTKTDEPLSIFLYTVATGERRRLTTPPPKTIGDSGPAFSPDGASIAFIRAAGTSVQDVYITSLSGGEPRRLTSDGRRIFGMAWDHAQGGLVYSSNRGQNSRLWRLSPKGGSPERMQGIGENAGFLAVSRQGNRLAYTRSQTDTNVWRYPLPGSPPGELPQRAISSTRHDLGAQISPNGERIVFGSNRAGAMELWICDKEGRNVLQLTSFAVPTGSARWSPDSQRIVFDTRPGGNPDIYAMSAQGGAAVRLTTDPADDVVPNFSRDGQWIYFSSNRSGTSQVWKMPAAGGEARQITMDGGFFAMESMDGRFLYYAKGLNAPGLWRIPSDGGTEDLIIEELRAGYWGYWAVTPKGIYFLNRNDDLDGRPRYILQVFDPVTRVRKPVIPVAKRPFNSGLSVSPDGRFFLYAQADAVDTDIMLVDNLR